MKVKLVNENFKTDYLNNILKERGLSDEQLKDFLHPTEKLLQDPKFLNNIEKGAQVLKETLMKKGRILIVVDCDCDGYTSSAIIYQYIKLICPDIVINYVIHEGKQHGLEDHIDKIIAEKEKYDLIIEPDAGTNDYEYHKQLAALNIPVLVIDHHESDGILRESKNVTIINNQLSINYNNKDLTGAGVTWQFCRYFDKFISCNYAEQFIDLAALGIIADMASVLNLENRYIISKGTAFPCENLFFETLIRKAAYSITGDSYASDSKINEKLTPTAVAFYIVPYINAMVRSGTLDEKKRMFEAFIHGDQKVVSHKRGANGALEKVAIESARECTNAKSKQDKMKTQMTEKLEIKIHKHGLLDNKILFVRLDDDDVFPSELNGLIAMQLSAKFKRPTIVARLNEEGYIRGSARGLSNCELDDFRQFLLDSGLFEYCSGHANAFGISIPNSKLSQFHELANKELEQIDFNDNVYEVNFERDGKDYDIEDIIFSIGGAPYLWGQLNKEPLIYVTNIKLNKGEWSAIGSKKDTLRFNYNGITYIKFRCADLIEELQNESSISIDLIGKMNINEWNGNYTPQIMIENLEYKDNRFSF